MTWVCRAASARLVWLLACRRSSIRSRFVVFINDTILTMQVYNKWVLQLLGY